MAQISPNIGVPQVAPDATPGNDYQNVRATPEQTGGLIAQGLDRFGAGATKAGDFFGEVQTDDASNNYQKAASELTEHFKTLNGADALNAQEDTKKQLDDLYRAARSGLTRPDQQLKFDSQNRPYTDRYILGQISTHAVQQGQTFALKTNADATDVAHNMAATAGSMGDEKTLAVARAKALDAQAKTLQTMGQENDPNAQATAISKANLVYKTYAETMAASGPQGALKAQQFLERPDIVKALGDNYAEVYSRTRAQADQAKADNLASAPLSAGSIGNPVTHAYNVATGKFDLPEGAGQGGKPGDTVPPPKYDASGNPIPQRVSAAAPIFTQAAAANPAGFSAAGLARTAQIESGGKANAVNGSMHGMFQFSPGTWASFGHGSPYDVTASTEAAQKYAAANSAALTNVLGRKPTDAELYVAHQQGLGGATALFTHPNESAVDALTPVYGGNRAIAEKAIRGNGGDPNAPASAFVNLWTGKFNGAKGATPFVPAGGQTMTMPAAGLPAALPPEQEPEPLRATQPSEDAVYHPEDAAMQPVAPPSPEDTATAIRAARVRMVEESDADPVVKQKALAKINEAFQAAMIAAQVDAKSRQLKKEAIVNDYDGLMLNGKYDEAYQKLTTDPRLADDNQLKMTLQDVIEKRSGQPSPVAYGPAYREMFKNVLAPPDDPKRLGNIEDVYKAELNGQITAKGAERLKTVMSDVRKNADEYGLQRQVSNAYDYANRHMSFEVDDGFLKIHDPHGKDAFDLQFTNIFNTSLDAWRREGKDVSQFPLFDQKKLDALIEQIRPKRQMEAERLAALGETPQAAEAPNTPLPPAPQGVDQTKWTPIISQPPTGKNGVIAHNAWANILSGMVEDPAKNVPLWNASAFVRNGAPRGEAVLSRLGIPYESKGRPEGVGAEPPASLQAAPLSPEKSQYEVEEEAAKVRRGTWWADRKAELSNLFASPDWKNMSPEEFHRLVGIPKPKLEEGK